MYGVDTAQERVGDARGGTTAAEEEAPEACERTNEKRATAKGNENT